MELTKFIILYVLIIESLDFAYLEQLNYVIDNFYQETFTKEKQSKLSDKNELNDSQVTSQIIKSFVVNLNNVNYGMKIELGSPAQAFNCIIETKTDSFWINGKDCTNCNKDNPKFDQSASSSFSLNSGTKKILNYTHTGIEAKEASDELHLPYIKERKKIDFLYVISQWRLDNMYFDGVFSLAFPGKFFIDLKNSNAITKAQVGLMLLDASSDSFITIGDPDPTVLQDSSKVKWIDVILITKEKDNLKVNQSRENNKNEENLIKEYYINNSVNTATNRISNNEPLKNLQDKNNNNQSNSKSSKLDFDLMISLYESNKIEELEELIKNSKENSKLVNNTESQYSNLSTKNSESTFNNNNLVKVSYENNQSPLKPIDIKLNDNPKQDYSWKIQGKDFKINQNTVKRVSTDLNVIIDSMYYGIKIPKAELFNFKEDFFPANSDCQILPDNYFHCSCDSSSLTKYPNMTFLFDKDVELVITPSEYVEVDVNQIDYDNSCKVLLSINYSDDYWVLGTPLLSKHYTLLDYENNKIGFYNVKLNKQVSKNQVLLLTVIIVASSIVFFALVYLVYKKFYNNNDSPVISDREVNNQNRDENNIGERLN